MKKVFISDIREDLYNAYLDTEYREALANSLRNLKILSDSPMNLHYGNEKEKRELEKVETTQSESTQPKESADNKNSQNNENNENIPNQEVIIEKKEEDSSNS